MSSITRRGPVMVPRATTDGNGGGVLTEFERQMNETFERLDNNDPTLKKLFWRSILYQNQVADHIAIHLAEPLRYNTSLTSLNLMINYIGSFGVTKICESLADNQTLVKLNLGSNHVDDDCAVLIGYWIGVNRSLTHLNLSNNEIHERGGKAIGQGLATNSTIQSLNLGFNAMRSKSVSTILKALEHNPTIEKLWINHTGLTGDKDESICKNFIAHTKSLTFLSLASNRIGGTERLDIVQALQENTTITHLNLCGVGIDAIPSSSTTSQAPKERNKISRTLMRRQYQKLLTMERKMENRGMHDSSIMSELGFEAEMVDADDFLFEEMLHYELMYNAAFKFGDSDSNDHDNDASLSGMPKLWKKHRIISKRMLRSFRSSRDHMMQKKLSTTLTTTGEAVPSHDGAKKLEATTTGPGLPSDDGVKKMEATTTGLELPSDDGAKKLEASTTAIGNAVPSDDTAKKLETTATAVGVASVPSNDGAKSLEATATLTGVAASFDGSAKKLEATATAAGMAVAFDDSDSPQVARQKLEAADSTDIVATQKFAAAMGHAAAMEHHASESRVRRLFELRVDLQREIDCNDDDDEKDEEDYLALKLEGIKTVRPERQAPPPFSDFARYLSTSPTLQVLDLRNNNFDDSQTRYIIRALQENVNIVEFHMDRMPEEAMLCVHENRKKDRITEINNESLLAEVLGRTSRVSLFHFIFRTRIDIMCRGFSGRNNSNSMQDGQDKKKCAQETQAAMLG